MSVDRIRYDILAQDALRGVVRTLVADAAKHGLPGEHHFYITFDTRADGVRLSARMLAQYPNEMTVVLQHQFWDLVATDDGFEVGLSFGGVPERLSIPFASIKGFYDPSVQFGLQFEEIGETAAHQDASAGAQEAQKAGSPDPSKRAKRSVSEQRTPPAPPAVRAPANPEPPGPAGTPPEIKPESGAEVVRLDRFRKK
jgi:hypothetical protein